MSDLATLRARHPRVFSRTPAERRTLGLVWGLGIALVVLALWRIDADPVRIWQGLSKLGFMLALMVPPSSGGVLPWRSWARCWPPSRPCR
jgi:phosphonate transport system permease protein